jgi:hypothetical protein
VAHAARGTTQQNARRYADSALREEVVDFHFDIASDLSHQRWRDVSTLVKGDRRAAPIGMTELLVRASLTNLDEPEPDQHPDHLMGL